MGKSPLIIIGMHRSGTSMTARLLEQNGCFLGANQILDLVEASAMVLTNDWILKQTNASWDQPEPWLSLPPKLKNYFSGYLGLFLEARWGHYVQPDRAEGLSHHQKCSIPWGWKDPRNSLTYVQWQKVFPQARFLHVYRNPVDVAWSLHRREVQRSKKMVEMTQKIGHAAVLQRVQQIGFSSRSFDLDGCFSLWKSYVSSCLNIDKALPKSPVLHVCYEDFLERPQEILPKILQFAQLEINSEILNESICGIRADRRFAFRENKNLVAFYQKIKDDELVKQLGYDQLV